MSDDRLDDKVPLAGPRWYVVKSKPREEITARASLLKLGFGVFLPRYPKPIRHARRVEVVFAPLFPCYLFVAFDAARQAWRPIFSARGVARLVTSGDVPLPIPAGELEPLIARCGGNELLADDPLKRKFVAGQRVIIVDGLFADKVAQYVGDDAGRVTLLLDYMGRSVTIRGIPESQVAASR